MPGGARLRCLLLESSLVASKTPEGGGFGARPARGVKDPPKHGAAPSTWCRAGEQQHPHNLSASRLGSLNPAPAAPSLGQASWALHGRGLLQLSGETPPPLAWLCQSQEGQAGDSSSRWIPGVPLPGCPPWHGEETVCGCTSLSSAAAPLAAGTEPSALGLAACAGCCASVGYRSRLLVSPTAFDPFGIAPPHPGLWVYLHRPGSCYSLPRVL